MNCTSFIDEISHQRSLKNFFLKIKNFMPVLTGAVTVLIISVGPNSYPSPSILPKNITFNKYNDWLYCIAES